MLEAAGTVLLLSVAIYSARFVRWLGSEDFRATAAFWLEALISLFRR